jgi:hypothetical protein
MFSKIKVAAAVCIALVSCSAAFAQVQFTFPIPFTRGTAPSVTSIRTGFVIEVNQSGDDTVFHLGQLSGQKITWGPGRVFPWKMYNVRINMSDYTGAVILSYTGAPYGGGCFYRVGRINTSGGLDQDFIWHTGEEKWGECEHTRDSRIVLDIFNRMYGVYSDFSQVFYRAGTMQNYRAEWQNGEPQYIGQGRDLDITSKEGQLLVLREEPGPGIIGSQPAKGPANGNQTIWGESVNLRTTGAVRGHATMKYSYPGGSVVAIYYKASIGLYTMTGHYSFGGGLADKPHIEWMKGEKEVFPGPVQHSDLTNTGTTVIELHEFEGQIFYAVAPMPPANFSKDNAGHAEQANSAAGDGQ